MQIAARTSQGASWLFQEAAGTAVPYTVYLPDGRRNAGRIEEVAELALDVDAQGAVHLLAGTRQGLIHMTSGDGGQWTRQTLTRFQPDSPALIRVLLAAEPYPTMIYQLQDDRQSSVICYRFREGRWSGRRLLEAPAAERLRLLQCLPGPDACLFYARLRQGSWAVERLPLSVANAVPQPFWQGDSCPEHFQCLTWDGLPAALWVANGRLLFNGQELPAAAPRHPCLIPGKGSLFVAYAEGNTLVALQQAGGAWQTRDRVPLGNRLPVYLVQQGLPGLLQWVTPGPELLPYVPDAPSRVVSPAPAQHAAPEPQPDILHAFEETLRAQATLLQRQQETLQGLQQRAFAMDAQLRQLEGELAGLRSLRTENAAIKLAMAALEDRLRHYGH